jgi:hypothetical protein
MKTSDAALIKLRDQYRSIYGRRDQSFHRDESTCPDILVCTDGGCSHVCASCADQKTADLIITLLDFANSLANQDLWAGTPSLSSLFATWLAEAQVTDDPVGDFIQDARSDRTFPRRISSVQTIRNHLIGKNACPGAHDAVDLAWQRFRGWRARRRRRERGQKLMRQTLLEMETKNPR